MVPFGDPLAVCVAQDPTDLLSFHLAIDCACGPLGPSDCFQLLNFGLCFCPLFCHGSFPSPSPPPPVTLTFLPFAHV